MLLGLMLPWNTEECTCQDLLTCQGHCIQESSVNIYLYIAAPAHEIVHSKDAALFVTMTQKASTLECEVRDAVVLRCQQAATQPCCSNLHNLKQCRVHQS